MTTRSPPSARNSPSATTRVWTCLPIIEPGIAPAAMRGVAAALAGSVTNASSTLWSMVSGPGIVSFSDAADPATTTFFSEPGNYLLRLTASNAHGEASRTLTVTVARTRTFSPTGNRSTGPA